MQSTKVCLIYLQNKIFRKEVRECRPQLCAIWSRKLTWGREAQTPSDWLRSDNQVMEKNFKADVGSLNRESFCTGLSATPPGGSHWLPSWSFGSCLGSLNCFCNHSVPLTENPTNFQKTGRRACRTLLQLRVSETPSQQNHQLETYKIQWEGHRGARVPWHLIWPTGTFFFWFYSRINIFSKQFAESGMLPTDACSWPCWIMEKNRWKPRLSGPYVPSP